MQTAEADLLAAFVQQRSEAAFAELVRRHLPMVLGVCRRVLEDDHAAQDAAQGVFLALARKAPALKREQALGGWLHHVALCAARNERTARTRRLRREQEAAAMQHDAIQELTPETTAALREWLDQELDKLPAKYRRPLVLVHLEGRSLEEAAAALKCKDGTLRVWLNRAREKLRNRLTRRGVSVSVPALVAWLASQSDSVAATVPPDLGVTAAKSAVLWITGGAAAANVVAIAKGALHAMFITKLKTAAVVTATVALVTTASALSWQKVYDARDKGLPKTAIEELKPIIADAMANKKYAEAIKAICTKIAFEGNIEGNKPEEKVIRLQAEIEKAPAEMKPMMEAVLAHWYWAYFQQNRWRFQQRTQTAEAPGKDFTTWDLPRILAEIDKHFTTALANEKLLKATPVAQYNDLLEKGNVPDTYRPTVFDFLAHEALQFYQAGEQGAAKAEDEFEIPATSPIFGTVAEFLAWKPATTDIDSPKLKAIKLFQNLLAFHQKDEDKSAFIDADLYRLQLGKNQSVGPEENDKYKAALKRFVDEWADHEISTRALFNWATVLVEENELVEAHKLAKRGADVFPKSYGGVLCFNLVQNLEQKQVSIATERVWNEPWPVIAVNYKNVTKAFFRAVPQDFDAFVARQRWGFGNGWDEKFIAELVAKQPVSSWDAALPATTDFRERTEKVPVAKDLKPGFYIILASHNASFGKDNNQVSAAFVWVSELALVVRQRQYEGALDGFVLKALTGEPVADAKVRSWTRDREGKLKPAGETKTDANGMFRFSGGDRQLLLLAEKGGQAVASDNEFYLGRNNKPDPSLHTVFFTDRSLYRPGQTIQYKGICYHVDTEGNSYGTLAGREVTISFRDPNGKEVAKAQHKANDYGAFSGSFTAPGGTVTGQMTLQVIYGPSGYAYFNVEEYKRPKFQVELSKPKDAPKLGAEVTMPGKATAYTGAAIGGAKVKWRVVREVQFPHWCWWGRYFLPPNRGDSQNIAHGTTTTGADGSFTIKFEAKPDLSLPEKTEPTFSFNVYADVTDSTGETRSDSQITRAGYTALSATVNAESWQTPDKPVEWTVSTTSLDGEPQLAEGTVKVYVLKQPDKVVRAELQSTGYDYWWFRRNMGKSGEPKADPSNPDSWELAEVVAEQPFKTDATGKVKIATPLKAGIYRAMLESKDRFGKAVTARQTLQVVDIKGAKYPVRLANHFAAPKWSVEPGESFVAFWGTGYDTGRAYVELEHRGKLLRAFWTGEGRTQEVFEQAVGEEMRGGFTMRLTYVRENRAYLENRVIDVPWSNKDLTVKWEHFTSKLEPGKKETWTAVITEVKGSKGERVKEGASSTLQPVNTSTLRAVAEMVATLYDASLDQYKPHQWMQQFNVFRREYSRVHAQFENGAAGFQHILGGWPQESRSAELTYRHYPHDITLNLWFFGYFGEVGGGGTGRHMQRMGLAADKNAAMMDGATAPALAAMADPGKPMGENKALRGDFRKRAEALGKSGGEEPAPGPDLSKVTARKNLNETAFFFPHIVSDADGVVRLEFTMPEALTEWKFMGFVHDRELRSGFLQDKTVTAKDLMVEPNPPRFVREGDIIEFTVKVSNQSAARQTGKVKLSLADARTGESRDADLIGVARAPSRADSRAPRESSGKGNNGNATDGAFVAARGARALPEQDFDIPSKESKSFAWRLSVPDGMDFLTYKAVGATDRLSDGEEGYLPVLSRRILVIESLPLPIRGAQTKKFEFTKLLESGKSRTLKSENLTVQMVSQPAWYAVMALPYLMEYPHECSEQVFNRLYANSLARFIANGDPKIRRIFDLWKNTPALDSPLEKNQDLKSVMIEETPWLRQANDESQARRNVGILFDANRLDNETRNTFQKLAQMQLGNGLWPWFPGCRGDEYITLYITTGFGRMRHLGAEGIDMSLAIKSLGALDGWMDQKYHDILKHMKNPEEYVPSSIDAFYLYGRSFFLKDKAIAKEHQDALAFYMKQAKKHWLKLDIRQSQGHLAIGMKRFGDAETPVAIMKSIKERSVSNEEMGLFWRDTELSWWWYRAPIETQALMIEAFDEVMGDAQAVEDAKVWLLKQKQTQDWKTTKATADAVYGLLLRGKNLLASDALVEVSLAGQTIKPEKVEAGTGFYEKKFVRGEIKPDMGKITVKKTDEGVSWGSVHWQYLEDMTKVTPYEGTPLKLKKSIWKKETEKTGQVLKPVTGPLAVGDELVVRVELRVDRDMEYVHLKDQRGSGTEPVNVLSRTKFQDGLAYYESTRDTASHFFIHYLPKGVYVFEYSVRVQLKGKYQTGIASIQCMYAPEFNSHSESFDLEVK
jgi:RNA polymerase sigma factor (sigma-70 family)